MYSNKHSYHAALYIREQGKVTELRASIDASQKKEKRMYGDNLAELLEYCDENENFCLLCCLTRTDVVVRHNCCQECDMV